MSSHPRPPVDEREWAAQERGMRAARACGMGVTDPAAESYRQVADALQSAPRSEPPADFASTVAAQVAVRQAGIERALLRSIALLLAAAVVVVLAVYGGQWWQAVQQASIGGALPWTLTAIACLALSWMVGGRWHRSADCAAG